MVKFEYFDKETAPDASKELLDNSLENFGMIPNLHAVMAASPQLLEAYQRVHELFMKSSFDNDELTVVWQTINMENNCQYCLPAHFAIAASMSISDDIVSALRENTPLPTEKLEALRTFTLAVMRDKGVVSAEATQAFLDAGYTTTSILDVILGYSQKIMSNYTNHIAKTELDTPFQKFS